MKETKTMTRGEWLDMLALLIFGGTILAVVVRVLVAIVGAAWEYQSITAAVAGVVVFLWAWVRTARWLCRT